MDTFIYLERKKVRATRLHGGKFRYFEFVVLSCQYAYCNRPTKYGGLEQLCTRTHWVPEIKMLYYSFHIVEFLQFPPFYFLLLCMLLCFFFWRPQPIFCYRRRVCTPLFALDWAIDMRHRAFKIDSIFQRGLLHTYTYTVDHGYNDIGLCDTSSISSGVLWCQLRPHC